MSWLFSQALVEEYSAVTCSDGEPSAQLNVMPTPHKFWRSDKTIEPSDHSRFGLTSQVLTESRGEELLMSFLADFHVRTLASPAPAPALMELEADSGRTWPGLLAKYDRNSHSWRTAQFSLLADSEEFSETWPRSGMTRNGMSYLRPTSARPICESASGFWPTPTVHGNHNMPGASSSSGWGLSSAVKLWPTPVKSDTGARKKPYAQGGTPLSYAARQWATPTRPDEKSGKFSPAAKIERDKQSRGKPLNEQVGGTLNPTWVEWLMGWPIGWTALEPLEMDKFHEWRQQHTLYSADNA